MSTLLSPAPGEFGKPWGKGVPTWTRDATADDSDKNFTVPAGKIWDLKLVRADIVCTATVGNRTLTIRITDGTNNIYTGPLTASIAGSQTGTILIGPAMPNTTTAAQISTLAANVAPAALSCIAMPPMLLLAGYVIRVWDSAAVDAAADDMTVILQYVSYDA